VIGDRILRTTYSILANSNYQTGFSYKFTNSWYVYDPIQRIEFMNAPKLCLFKRDHWAWQTKVQ